VEVGVQFQSDVNGYITGIRFYKSAKNTGTHVGNLWTGGTQLATATFTGESASGWQQVSFSSPVAIFAGKVYVASYHMTSGHYAADTGYFSGKAVDNSPLHAAQDSPATPNGVYAYGTTSSFPTGTWQSTNYWVDVVFVSGGADTTPPTVQSVSPAANAIGVDPQSQVTATFSEPLDPTTVSGSSMQLFDPSSSLVASAITYNSGNSLATLTPNAALLNSVTYTVVLKGGFIKDVAGNALSSDYTWSFTTAAPPPPPPTEGPGGPILIVSSSTNPFSRYYAEILRNEGFNEFTAMDISLVSASTLGNYQVVILGNFPLTAAQAGMFTTWANNGGNLIAMRPDKQLASALGLTDTGTVLNEGYLLMNTAYGAGTGLVNQTIQFHGNADLYIPNGATTLATLYSSATAPTANPAVTLNSVGLGQAAAFTYDLAQSVIYTRQGNPAWSGQARDGQSGPVRSDDLYFGNAPFDPEPDYIDRNKIAIPQADEQQRLLANLILQMNLAKQPLPRFWYFPHDYKAAVVLTGDDHGAMYGGGVTASRFAHYQSLSATGCSVSDWQCVRATAYLIAPSIASNPLTNSQAASYIAQGFEVGIHIDSVPDCTDWTPSQLASFYSTQASSFLSTYPSVKQLKTHRMHCIGWSDYDSQPQVELQNGIRLDTTYYYWPPCWVNDTPGMFTGSGMPMRYTKRDGTMLDIYQAVTQMTDESGQSYPLHIDTLLDNAIGATGYYGYFTANMHNDSNPSTEADDIIASAQSRGVPIISADQLLTWLDGRNGSSFTSQSWNGSTLTFGISVGANANGLEAMLPASWSSGVLNSISLNGSAIAFTTETIKGVSYAVFPASAGTYQANYGSAGSEAVASVSTSPSTVIGGSSSTGTVVLSGPAPVGGILVTLSSSNTAAVQVPASVVVAANATGATFAITTNQVPNDASITISATYGSTATTSLRVTAAVLNSLALNPTTVPGGAGTMGTLTLSAPAPASGAVVALSSSNTTAAQVPASVTAPANTTTVIFNVTTAVVSVNTTATISATYGGTKTASLAVTRSLSAVSVDPTSVLGGNSSTGTVTLAGAAPAGGAVVALSSNSAAAQVPASVTVAAGATTATFTITTSTVTTGTPVTISGTYGVVKNATLTVTTPALSSITLSPSSVLGGNTSTGTVTLTGPAPGAGAVVTLSSSNTTATKVPSNVTVAAGKTTATFTISTSAVTSNASVTITGNYGVAKTATLTVTSAALSTVSVNPTSVLGRTSSTGTVTLTGAAPPGGAVVTLSSSNTSAAQVPASVTVTAGLATANFAITTSAVASNATVTITARLGTVSRTASLTVTAPTVSSLTLNPTTVKGGTPSTGTVTLNGPAPSAGTVVTLSSNATTVATVPSSVTVTAGNTSATFTVTTLTVTASRNVIISATKGTTSTATLAVTP
jgi:hypothetical protein